MKDIVSKLNKAFENRIRLGIMSALMVNETLDFNSLKDLLGTSDGNLSSHLSALEKDGLISISKQFVNRKPNTTYAATVKGRKAFREHLDLLEKLIHNKNV